MKASDIMTRTVITARADDTVDSVVEKLLTHRISAVPIVDDDDRVLGIVSEGDLMNRPETNTARRRPWWLELFSSPEEDTREFLKMHGTQASDVMTDRVITVSEDASAVEIARTLERHQIKRVPVVRDGRLVGIVSRANLLRSFASGARLQTEGDAPHIRAAIINTLDGLGIMTHLLSVTVNDDSVQLWGLVTANDQIDAATGAAERVAPDKTVINHLSVAPLHLGHV